MTWILILALIDGTMGDGVALTSIEFTSKASCEVAAQQWQKQADKASAGRSFTTCTER